MTKPIPRHSEGQQESISALAQLAIRYSGANSYGLYVLDASTGALRLRSSAGPRPPMPDDLTINVSLSQRQGRSVRSYPLRVSGSVVAMLAFSFGGSPVPEDRLSILDRMARAIETLYCLPCVAKQLFDRVNGVETEIVTDKIGTRAQGLLRETPQDDALYQEAIDVIERQVETILRSSRLWTALERLLHDGEEELAERKLTAQAKTLLQEVHGMSEQEAYQHLRNASRRSRKPIPAVARELIMGDGAHTTHD
jgi:hypothetical protein